MGDESWALNKRPISPDGKRTQELRAQLTAIRIAKKLEALRALSPSRVDPDKVAALVTALKPPEGAGGEGASVGTAPPTARRVSVGPSPAPLRFTPAYTPSGSGSVYEPVSEFSLGENEGKDAAPPPASVSVALPGSGGRRRSGGTLKSGPPPQPALPPQSATPPRPPPPRTLAQAVAATVTVPEIATPTPAPLIVSVLSSSGAEVWQGSYAPTQDGHGTAWVCKSVDDGEAEEEEEAAPYSTAPAHASSEPGYMAPLSKRGERHSRARDRGTHTQRAISRSRSPSPALSGDTKTTPGKGKGVEWPGAMLPHSRGASVALPPMSLHLHPDAGVGYGKGKHPSTSGPQVLVLQPKRKQGPPRRQQSPSPDSSPSPTSHGEHTSLASTVIAWNSGLRAEVAPRAPSARPGSSAAAAGVSGGNRSGNGKGARGGGVSASPSSAPVAIPAHLAEAMRKKGQGPPSPSSSSRREGEPPQLASTPGSPPILQSPIRWPSAPLARGGEAEGERRQPVFAPFPMRQLRSPPHK